MKQRRKGVTVEGVGQRRSPGQAVLPVSGKRVKGAGKQRSGGQHFVRGKPLKSHRLLEKARRQGIYGCGHVLSKRRCRWFGLSERAVFGQLGGSVVAGRERTMKAKRLRGPERKRKERETRQGMLAMGTVRA